MRKPWIAALAVLALLAGCNNAGQQDAQKTAAPAIAPGTTITGTVTLRDQIPIGPGAKLDVKLVDVAQPELAIAEKTIDITGAPPYSFALDFDPAKITANRTYVINAVLTDGPRRFLPALNSPVLTHGSTTATQVVLTAEPTPAEKLAEECTQLEKRIGALRKVDGTYTTDDASIGWDAFAEKNRARFVRVNTDYDKGGHASVNYAYKDDKPMCVKEPGGVRSQWNVGWDDAGQVLFNKKAGGGSLSDGEIAALHDSAGKAFQMAQDKVDASRHK